jgi:cell filamentation protein
MDSPEDHIDPYTDPSTGTLRNLIGVTDRDELAEIEADVSAAALIRIAVVGLPGPYDLGHLCGFHRAIFGSLYPWAGQLRTVAIAKSDMFCLPQHIENYATGVFAHLAEERHLRGLAREPFLRRLVHYFAEVNAIHPFREGNGRTQRAFFGQLAQDAGWRIDWSGLDPHENAQASMDSLRGDTMRLYAMLERLVNVRRSR